MSNKIKIVNFVVVEGKSDTENLKRFFDVDTIETKGLANDLMVMEKIKLAHKKRGVIIFTDPDHAGQKIRKTISQTVNGCLHAYLVQAEAKGKNGKVGVEYASRKVLIEALSAARVDNIYLEEVISMRRLIAEDLISGRNSRIKRDKLGKILKIGYANGKQLYNNLKKFGITLKQFENALDEIEYNSNNI